MGFFKESKKDKGFATMPYAETPEEEGPAPPSTRPGYGIDEAIALMRALPEDLQTSDMVAQVVKRTLLSVGIDVSGIIVDATRREQELEERIRVVQDEVAAHQLAIEKRTAEIRSLKRDLEETSKTKEHLILAEKLTS